MKTNKRLGGAALILLAGIFWGSMGLFVRTLTRCGFDPLQITAMRLSLSALFFLLLLARKDPAGMRLQIRDLPLFLASGIGSILMMTLCYFTAIDRMPLSTAAILLYTSPIWVMLLSVLVFRERLSGKKPLALALAFSGCVLVSGLSGGGLTPLNLLIGLGAGFSYGLYSILGRIALRRYSAYAVSAYTFLFAAAGSWFFCRPAALFTALTAVPSPVGLFLLFLLMALVTAFVPFLSYTLGLQSLEASRAAILATVEPLVAALFGVLVFHESMGLGTILGILLILSAVVLLSMEDPAAQPAEAESPQKS